MITKTIIRHNKTTTEPMPRWFESVVAASVAVDAEDAHWRRVDGRPRNFPRFADGVRS